MKKKVSYPNIDMIQTGKKLKHMIDSAGYTPRMIQDYLHLSCVQPIYRWYKGLILPSVDHLFMLSELLDVHMEDLLVKKQMLFLACGIEKNNPKTSEMRYIKYYRRICQAMAWFPLD